MGGVTEVDVAAAIGRIDEIIIREIVRTGASRPNCAGRSRWPRGRAISTPMRPCRRACSVSSTCSP